ncbi:MAG: tRNA (adenosine(37)-N6)-dimethylallyltransferase MiaA [Pseudomonadota bacterium]
MSDKATVLRQLSPEQPVLLAGPTGSGKSALALEIAQTQGGVIINADALQVYDNWRVLTARPSREDEACVPHHLYGHVGAETAYSVGAWLRDFAPFLQCGQRPIIVGGTGLYFTALTRGLAGIPPIPAGVRAKADTRLANEGPAALLAELDAPTRHRLDSANPARIQRAWEVLTATGQGLAAWHAHTPAPILRLGDAQPLLIDADRDWLTERIERRFDAMIAAGALDEVAANLAAGWTPERPSAKAIGAPELVAYLKGNRSLKDAVAAGKTATRQFAKRQRTWFRSKMREWTTLALP